MLDWYNPIVRVFGQYRAALCAAEGLPRDRVTAHARLDALIPRGRRRALWATFQAGGLRVPSLELSPAAYRVWVLLVLAALGGLRLWAGIWWPSALALVPLCYAAFRLSRPWAVHLPPFINSVGELAVYGTRFGDHANSGYRWSHGDVSLKVRMVFAESMGVPLERVKPESTWAELGMR